MTELNQEIINAGESELILLQLKTPQEIYAAYMPFIKKGALFVKTRKTFSIGQSVLLSLELGEEKEVFNLKGKVVWLTPFGAQAGLAAGIGVQFLDEKTAEIQKKIQAHIAGLQKEDLKTDTL